MNFDFVFLGQSVLKYQVPLEVFVGLNELYETKKKDLPNANKQLAGKIPDEVSLFYDGKDTSKMHRHSFVSEDILKWFYSVFKHYLDWNKTQKYTMDINSIWVNEMKANEYNPPHNHAEDLSFVIYLQVPAELEKELKESEGVRATRGPGTINFGPIGIDMPFSIDTSLL